MQSEAALTTVIALATLVGLPGVGLLEDPMQGMIPIVLVALLGRLTVLPLLASYTDQNNSHVWPSTVVQTSIGVLQNTLMFYILGVGFGAPLLIWIDKTLLASIYAAAMIDPSSAYTVFKLFSRKSQNVSLSSQDQHVFWRLVATMMGAWIGAFITPLDWQKDYQKYPLPILGGLLGGQLLFFSSITMKYVLSRFIG